MAEQATHQLENACERRDQVRIIVNLAGHFVLVKRRAAGGSRPEYACRLVNISPGGMMLAAQQSVVQSEPVIAHFDEFGMLEGAVLRPLAGGFAMSISAGEAQRQRLAAKLVWMERKQIDRIPDLRRHARRVPRNTQSTLMLADGSIRLCRVIDMSCTGTAVSTEIAPAIGTPLAIGKVVGRVVRQFDDGIAVQFIEPQDDRILDRLLLAPQIGPAGLSLGDIVVNVGNSGNSIDRVQP